MKRVDHPSQVVTLRDLNDDSVLRVVGSNQGEPYRQTLLLTFERGAHGSFAHYEHLGSVELEGHEELQLRDFLNMRNPPRKP